MKFDGRDAVVTGGTGALGAAVVGALVQARAACTVPWLHEKGAGRFTYRGHKQVKLLGFVAETGKP
jgi:NAD(P)-dependent dehydrogenase (short-subunit alcohol dehydrogenase family)